MADWNRIKVYMTNCDKCGSRTSKQYAKQNNGLCKSCVTGKPTPNRQKQLHQEELWHERRQAMIIDHGYQAVAREEGHYGY